LLVVTEETQSKFLEEKNSQEEYEGIIFSTQPSTKEMMLAFKKLVPGGKIAVKMTNGKANFLNFVMCGFIDIKSDEIEVVANKPKFKIGTSQQLKPKQPENSSPKQSENSTTPNQQEIIIEKKPETISNLSSFAQNKELDQNLIKEDDLLEKEDLLVKPKSNDDCETTSERKACKNCSCGRAEEIEKENLNVENNVEIKSEKKSSCGNCYLGDAFRCTTCPHLGKPAFKPGEMVTLDLEDDI